MPAAVSGTEKCSSRSVPASPKPCEGGSGSTKNMRLTEALLHLLFIFIIACSCTRKTEPMTSIGALQKALVATGWSDVEFQPVENTALSEVGITEAGLIYRGMYRIEVYHVADTGKIYDVAGFFAESGDPVFTSGQLVVLVPSGRGDQDVIEILTRLGFVGASAKKE